MKTNLNCRHCHFDYSPDMEACPECGRCRPSTIAERGGKLAAVLLSLLAVALTFHAGKAWTNRADTPEPPASTPAQFGESSSALTVNAPSEAPATTVRVGEFALGVQKP